MTVCRHIIPAIINASAQKPIRSTMGGSWAPRFFPIGATNAPPKPSAMAGTHKIYWARQLLSVPIKALTATAPRAIPMASLMGRPRSSISSGTAKIEPPAPVSPSTRPITRPITTDILFIPRHTGQSHAHTATVGDTGEYQASPDKG